MSTSATGRIVDENQSPIASVALRVLIRDESALLASDLGYADSDPSTGNFTVTYSADVTPELGVRKLGVYVYSQAHRQLAFKSAAMPQPAITTQVDDVTQDTLPLGDLQVRKDEATGWTVTLHGSDAVSPVRDGNAILPLIDDQDAWNHLKDSMVSATSAIDILQLEFDVPSAYNADDTQEKPEVVISFGDPFDPAQGRKADSTHNDYRPERVLLGQAKDGATVRVMIGVATTPIEELLLPILVLFVLGFNLAKGSFHQVKGYFDAANQPPETAVRMTPFDTPLFSRIHAKVVLVDDAEAIMVSSPFTQSYWDTHTDGHHVIDAHRGSATGEVIPVHDVSLAVKGPAVKDVHDAYRLHWNRDLPQADQIAAIDPPAAVTTPDQGWSIASLQLVRSIRPGAFTSLPDGEQGILEAYLRAIENAQNYIYLENQYFTNETIGKALVAALNDTKNRPDLRVIFMLNVSPDANFYPGWQRHRINRIRTDAGANAARIGFFTLWTHDPPASGQDQETNPMIMPNYLHSKFAIVDGKWATIGSANLDGVSLDYNEYLRLIQLKDYRNHELNYVIYSNIDGHPATDGIDVIRRALWGEHLGIDPADNRFDSGPDGKALNVANWLDLWHSQAAAKQAGLTSDPATIDPAKGRVLEVPATVKTGAQDFLKECQIDLTKLDFIEKTRAFNFSTGAWA